VFLAEIGDVARFPTDAALCCWAGLTPRHYESDKTVHRGHLSKEGDTLVRWAAVEAHQPQTEPVVKAVRDGIVARRGKTVRNIAKVAAARRMLEVVYYVCSTAGPAASPKPRHECDQHHEPDPGPEPDQDFVQAG
jgi:transposase